MASGKDPIRHVEQFRDRITTAHREESQTYSGGGHGTRLTAPIGGRIRIKGSGKWRVSG